ncbi:MAG: hypothetical protein ACRD3W_19510, partial [Terriglobales bacterium]
MFSNVVLKGLIYAFVLILAGSSAALAEECMLDFGNAGWLPLSSGSTLVDYAVTSMASESDVTGLPISSEPTVMAVCSTAPAQSAGASDEIACIAPNSAEEMALQAQNSKSVELVARILTDVVVQQSLRSSGEECKAMDQFVEQAECTVSLPPPGK